MTGPRNTTAWGIGLTDTFRNSSKALFKRPSYKGLGTNLQNPSDRICQLYIPDEGKVFLQADQSGAEALIVSYLCRSGNYRNLFTYGVKPHTYTALHMFKEEWYKKYDKNIINTLCSSNLSDIKSNPHWKEVSNHIKEANPVGGQGLQYYLGKKANHSFNYQKQPSTFIFDVLKESEGKIVLSLKDSQYIYNTYHSLYPEIQEWHREQKDFLYKTRELRNLFGYPRKFYGAFNDKFFREAISFIPQSTVGCITNIAFCQLQELIEGENKDWDLLNNKHDSILLQCPVEENKEAANTLAYALEMNLVSPRGEQFKMKSEVSIGRNWGKHHSIDNPEGLKEI